MEKKPEYEVEILDVRTITTYPVPDKPVETHVITWRYGYYPPQTLYILAEEDTPEERKRRIREDLDKLLAIKPERLTV